MDIAAFVVAALALAVGVWNRLDLRDVNLRAAGAEATAEAAEKRSRMRRVR